MQVESVKVYKDKAPKKFRAEVVLSNESTPCTVRFGYVSPDDPNNDYPHHRDSERRKNYLQRHRSREDWTKAGACTPGFWSRWMLWGHAEPDDIRSDLSKKLGVPVKFANGVAEQLRRPYRHA